MRNYLFVCKHNFTRSKHGVEFLKGFLKGKRIEAKVSSAGLGISSVFLGRMLNKKILGKANCVFVMEKWMKDKIIEKFNFDKDKIIVLNIKDDYGFLKGKSISDLDRKFMEINWENILNDFSLRF